MPIPDYQSLMLPVLSASSRGEVRVGTVVDELALQLGLSPQERGELLPSGRQAIFANRVHWAKTYLSKAHLVEAPRRGHFRITPRGVSVLESMPARIDNKFLMQFEEFNQFRDQSCPPADQHDAEAVPPLEDQTRTPDETMRLAFRQIDVALGQDLLDRVRSAPPEFFEH